MKISVILKPCPWCRKTPELYTPLHENCGGTWLWYVKCVDPCCTMNPESRKVPIRKTGKKNPYKMAEKLELLAKYWNTNNPYAAYERKELDLKDLQKWVK